MTAIWRAHKRGALFANPCFTQIHPTCIPVTGDYQSKLTLMSESLRNDGRIWVPLKKGDKRAARPDPRSRARLLPRAPLSELRQPGAARRGLAQRQAGLRRRPRRGETGLGVYLDFADAIRAWASRPSASATATSSTCTSASPTRTPTRCPMRIYPAIHYTMGGLWVDYNLMSTIPGLFVLGEANFSDHGANRLGASALMQGLADGYFVIPYTIGNYLASNKLSAGARYRARVQASGRRASSRPSSCCSRSRASARSIPSTASWARSCGTTAACRAPRQGLESRHWPDSARCARSSGRTSTSPAAARS